MCVSFVLSPPLLCLPLVCLSGGGARSWMDRDMGRSCEKRNHAQNIVCGKKYSIKIIRTKSENENIHAKDNARSHKEEAKS